MDVPAVCYRPIDNADSQLSDNCDGSPLQLMCLEQDLSRIVEQTLEAYNVVWEKVDDARKTKVRLPR